MASEMGEWKAQLSLRVRQAFAAREKRKLGNLAELILEWVFEQLKTAGSTQDLLKYGIRRHESRTKRNEENRTIAT